MDVGAGRRRERGRSWGGEHREGEGTREEEGGGHWEEVAGRARRGREKKKGWAF